MQTFPEIGDLLNADSNDITLQETGAAYDEGVKAASSGSAATGTKEKADDEKKKPKKKKGFFAKLAATLFGEEEESTDVEHVEVPESRDLENISDENLQILKELEAAEQAGAAKEDKKQAKKDKKKAREREERKRAKGKETKKEAGKEGEGAKTGRAGQYASTSEKAGHFNLFNGIFNSCISPFDDEAEWKEFLYRHRKTGDGQWRLCGSI